METKPYIGQKVKLNDNGMESIGGIMKVQDFIDSQNATVLSVESIPMSDGDVWVVECSGFLKKFLLTSVDIDEV